MPQDGSSAGLGFEAGLGFGGVSRFGVGLGLGISPRRPQTPNQQQGSGLGNSQPGLGNDMLSFQVP